MSSTAPTCIRPPSIGDTSDPTRDRGPDGVADEALTELIRTPWTLRVGATTMLVRPSSPRDLPAVAQLHRRCSPRSLLDRFRQGGRPPAVYALEQMLRQPLGVVAGLADGSVIACGSIARDPNHNPLSAHVGLLVQDSWQGMGIGSELVAHLAGAAHAAGFHELISYPATAMAAAQRLMIEVGRTRVVPDVDPHLHTYLSESSTLGLGSVRQRLAG